MSVSQESMLSRKRSSVLPLLLLKLLLWSSCLLEQTDKQLREYARNRSRQWPVLGVYVSAVKLLQGNPDIGHYSAKEKKLLQTGLTWAFSHSHPHRCVYIWLWYLCHNVVFSFPIVNWWNNVGKTSCWPITEISNREERKQKGERAEEQLKRAIKWKQPSNQTEEKVRRTGRQPSLILNT